LSAALSLAGSSGRRELEQLRELPMQAKLVDDVFTTHLEANRRTILIALLDVDATIDGSCACAVIEQLWRR